MGSSELLACVPHVSATWDVERPYSGYSEAQLDMKDTIGDLPLRQALTLKQALPQTTKTYAIVLESLERFEKNASRKSGKGVAATKK